MDQRIEPATLNVNLSPDAFHLWAQHYLQCFHDFRAPEGFSPVPYFLLCRAVELELKARHLRATTQESVRKEYGHDLVRSYRALPAGDQVLTDDEVPALRIASDMYKRKGFEYWLPRDALTGYSAAPDLITLEPIAEKLIDTDALALRTSA